MPVLRASYAWCFACGAIVSLLCPSESAAQFGGGGGGRRGGGFQPAVLRELGRDSIVQELKLTEDQQAQVRALSEAPPENGEELGELIQAMREAESEELRTELRAEMQRLSEVRDVKIEEQLKTILNETQAARLEQIVLHRAGPSALSRPDRADKLKLTEDQRQKLADLSAERQAGMFGNFGMSREERQAAEQQWNEKYLAVLTAEQKEQWTAWLGPAPPESPEEERGLGRGFGRRGGGERGGGERGERGPAAAASSASPPASAPGGNPPAAAAPAQSGPKVASFDPANGATEGKVSFNFQAAPWGEVLRDFARRAGLTLEMKDTPPGTFTYFDRGEYTPKEALDVLNGPLLRLGYVLVRKNEFLICANIDKGPAPNLIPYITSGQLAEHGDNELLTVVFSVKGVQDIATLATQVHDMLGPQGKAVGVAAAGALVVTDLGGNLRRVDDMLRSMSALLGPEDVKFQPYPLVHIAAMEAEQLLRGVLGLQVGVKNVSGGDRRRGGDDGGGDRGRRGWWGRGGDDNNQGGGESAQPETSPFAEGLLAKTQLTPDSRTNQLLVVAPAAVHVLIDQALKTIDVEPNAAAAGRRRDSAPYFHAYELRTASVEEAAKTINAIMPGIVINDDSRGDRIHIMATASQHREVEELMRRLDGQGGGQNVAVIPLSKMDPLVATSTLQQMFIREGTNAPTIQADLSGRQVMIRGTSDQIEQVKTLLVQLGEDGTGRRSRGVGGPVRRFSLGGRDGDRLLELIDQAWNSTQPNRIEIVPARSRRPVRNLEPPAETRFPVNEPGERPARRTAPVDEEPVSLRDALDASQFVAFLAEAESSTDDSTASAQPDAGAESSSEAGENEPTPAAEPGKTERAEPERREVAPGIFIQVEGDELILMSEDEAALDRLEEMLEGALMAIPASTTWTVFTLQSADATEAAEMLERLIPDASVADVSSTTSSSGFFSSLSSMGSSLMSASGLNSGPIGGLQIIPEVRLNALFVSGPASKVQEVEDFLEVLDSSDWPGTLRDRVPHMIPVRFAEIADVHRVVRDVYRDYLEGTPAANGGNNPFALFMGGGGRGGRDQQQVPRDIKLTVGMDEQTSHLIVSADEGLYQEILELVTSLDNAAHDARRTVRVVELRNANTSAVQGTLGAVMPRVRVSTSGSRSSRSDSSSRSEASSSSGSSGQQQGPSQDQARQWWEQRMRDRGSSGGDGERRSFFSGRGGGDSGRFGGGDRGGRGSFGGRRGFGGRN